MDKEKNVILIGVDSLRYDIFERSSSYQKFKSKNFTIGKLFIESGPTAPSHSTLFSGEKALSGLNYNHGVLERKNTLFEDLASLGFDCEGIASCFWLGRHFGYSRGCKQFFEAYGRIQIKENVRLLSEDFGKFNRHNEIEKLNKNLKKTEGDRVKDLEFMKASGFHIQDVVPTNMNTLFQKLYQAYRRRFVSIDEIGKISSELSRKHSKNRFVWMYIEELHELIYFDPPKTNLTSYLIYLWNVMEWKILSKINKRKCYEKSVKYVFDKIDLLLDEKFSDFQVIIYSDHGFNLGDFCDHKNAFSFDVNYLKVPILIRNQKTSNDIPDGFEIIASSFKKFILELASTNTVPQEYYRKVKYIVCSHGGNGACLPGIKKTFSKRIKI